MSESTTRLMATANIVAGYIRRNYLAVDQLPGLIQAVQRVLTHPTNPMELKREPLAPAVSIKKSAFEDYLVCLDCGQKLKSLKRHLNGHVLTPVAYREKWGLPRDYPMVAPAYAKSRSELAKRVGLGNKRRSLAEPSGHKKP